MTTLGSVIDAVAKPAWLDLVHTVEGGVPEAALTLATDAAQKVAAANTAKTDAQTSLDAAADALAKPVVTAGLEALKGVPIIGPLIANPEAEGAANELTDLALNALIGELQSLLAAKPA